MILICFLLCFDEFLLQFLQLLILGIYLLLLEDLEELLVALHHFVFGFCLLFDDFFDVAQDFSFCFEGLLLEFRSIGQGVQQLGFERFKVVFDV
jgi:hypothetical protein